MKADANPQIPKRTKGDNKKKTTYQELSCSCNILQMQAIKKQQL
jgi:hypothetical protein